MALLVRQGLQHVIDHAEMVVVVLVLRLQVDQVGGEPVQPLGEERRELEGDLGIRLQEVRAALDHVQAAVRDRAHRRHVRLAEQQRDLAEDGTGIDDGRDLERALQDLDLARDQHIEQA